MSPLPCRARRNIGDILIGLSRLPTAELPELLALQNPLNPALPGARLQPSLEYFSTEFKDTTG